MASPCARGKGLGRKNTLWHRALERLGKSGATHDSQSASTSGVEAWVARNLNGWDDSDAGATAYSSPPRERARAHKFAREFCAAETLANPNCPPSKWWQLAKELCDLNGRNSTTIPPLRTCAQDTVKNDQEKANLLNHTFINQNTCLNLEGFPIGPTQLKSVFTIQDICPADVRKIIKSLPNKASFGSDEISYRLLKEAGPGVVGPLTTLFNLSLHSNRVPDEWKEAIVCPIFKGGRKARQDPTNYRPISLTSCVARTMEKLVNNQMLAYLSENSLLYKHQSGFLPNHSTVTQLCYPAHQWQMALEKGEQVHTVFLDLSKAYDRVSIPGLLFKLFESGFFKRNFTMDVIVFDG